MAELLKIEIHSCGQGERSRFSPPSPYFVPGLLSFDGLFARTMLVRIRSGGDIRAHCSETSHESPKCSYNGIPCMADREFSRYQKKVIQRYYDNRPQVDEQRLSELVAELYLASEKKKPKLWETARDIMIRLGTPESRVEHVMKTANAAILAEVVKDVQSGKIRPKPPEKPPEPPVDE